MKNQKMIIGVLGGMGTYATIHLFKEYARIFSAEKEWDRPRILIDNRCTMPSRVRAFLYNENRQSLVKEMTESILNLIKSGSTRIILACNTAHLFLPEIIENSHGLIKKENIENIILNCIKNIEKDEIQSVYLLASEGTIESNIYQNYLEEKCIKCITPLKTEYNLLRECIESVKQDKYSERTKNIFLELVNKYSHCVLGCTELPILYDKYKEEIENTKIYDPLCITLQNLKKEYDND